MSFNQWSYERTCDLSNHRQYALIGALEPAQPVNNVIHALSLQTAFHIRLDINWLLDARRSLRPWHVGAISRMLQWCVGFGSSLKIRNR